MSGAGSVPAQTVVAPDHSSTPVPGSASYDYDRDDPTFLDALRASRRAVKHVARWLKACGYSGIIHATHERPSPTVMHLYRDPGDITVTYAGVGLRVEVKQRTFPFTSPADYPYGTVQIVQCNKFDGVWPPPFLYVIVSQDFRAGILVDVAATRAQWLRVPRYQGNAHRVRDMYECPHEHVTFFCFDAEP